MILGKMPRQQRNVFLAFSQRRQVDLKHIHPIIQILAKSIFCHHHFQILMRSTNHPDIDPLLGKSADPPHRFFLQHAQQFRLQVGAHITDFIKKQGATVS